jgi:hypothetical protein
MIGKTDQDLFATEHADGALAVEQKIIATGQPIIGIEEKETWPDGRETWVSTSPKISVLRMRATNFVPARTCFEKTGQMCN